MGEVCQAETFSFLSTGIRVEQIRHELGVCHAIKDQLGITNSEELPYTFESMYSYLRADRMIQQSCYGVEFYLGKFYTTLIFRRPCRIL